MKIKNKKGFTLIEVLVAVLILTVTSAALATTVTSATEMNKAGIEIDDSYKQGMQSAQEHDEEKAQPGQITMTDDSGELYSHDVNIYGEGQLQAASGGADGHSNPSPDTLFENEGDNELIYHPGQDGETEVPVEEEKTGFLGETARFTSNLAFYSAFRDTCNLYRGYFFFADGQYYILTQDIYTSDLDSKYGGSLFDGSLFQGRSGRVTREMLARDFYEEGENGEPTASSHLMKMKTVEKNPQYEYIKTTQTGKHTYKAGDIICETTALLRIPIAYYYVVADGDYSLSEADVNPGIMRIYMYLA